MLSKIAPNGYYLLMICDSSRQGIEATSLLASCHERSHAVLLITAQLTYLVVDGKGRILT
jgi:hypothetical protein